MGAWDGSIRVRRGSLPVGANGQGYLVIDLGEAAETRWPPAPRVLKVVVRFW
jgi:hypothetical protein